MVVAVVVLESSLSFPFSLRQSRATLGSQALSLAPQSSLVLSLAFAASFLFPWRTTRTEMSRWFRVVLSGTHKTLRRKGTMGNVVGVAAFYCSFEAPQTFFFAFWRCRQFFLSHLRWRFSSGKHRILHGILWRFYVFTMRPYLHLYLVYLYISNTARLQCSPNRGGVLCHFALRGLLHAAATLL